MGEVVVTVGVIAVAFGPKDIPVIARGLGRVAGQAVGACRIPSPPSLGAPLRTPSRAARFVARR
jgi:hypothetical protein